MAVRHPLQVESPVPHFRFYGDHVELRTDAGQQFIDVTELVAERVRRSGIAHGIVNVQSRHTTAAVLVNENEPGLLDDLAGMLARLAPRDAAYRHDDLEGRAHPVPPDERPNGHAHLRAAALGPAACLNVVDGKLQLGRWQRIFLAELDGARKRALSIHVLGLSRG
jgi:secondary thiamine-phosphate synthase enzyme